MKTENIHGFTASELRAQFPSAFDSALRRRNDSLSEIPWQDETLDSLKSLLKAADIKLRNWSLGAYNRGNHISIAFPGDDATAGLSGKRAFAWLENNLLAQFRIPFFGKRRADVRRFGKYYRPGMITPCPFTGMCSDDELIEALTKSVRSGDDLKTAFASLADTVAEMLEREDEANRSADSFSEEASANDRLFDEDGAEVTKFFSKSA
jgi:hypothetical protein